jgi:hypothetical protein
MFVSENKVKLERFLIAFCNYYDNHKTINSNLTIAQIRDNFIRDEITQEIRWNEICKGFEENIQNNKQLLKEIKKRKGNTFYKHLLTCITESEANWEYPFELTQKPIGNYQEESYGRSIKGIWVIQQRSVGIESDSLEGTICVLIDPEQYLKFYFSM